MSSSSDMAGMDDTTSTTSTTTMMMIPYLHATLPSSDPLLFSSWMPSSAGAVVGASVGLFFLAVLERFLRVVSRGMEGYWRRDALRRIPLDATTFEREELDSLTPTASNTYTATSSSSTDEKYLPGGQSSSRSTPALKSPGLSQRPISSSTPTPSASSTFPPDLRTGPSSDILPPRRRHRQMASRTRWNVPFVWRNDLARGGLEGLATAVRYALMLSAMTFNLFYIGAIVLGAAVGETLFGRHGNVH